MKAEQRFGLTVPPLLMLVICLGLIVLTHYFFPLTVSRLHAKWAVVTALLLAIVSVTIMLLGVITFRRYKTTVDPRYPHKSRALVTSGIYRLTRNPMYLGMVGLLFALTIWYANPLGLLSVILFCFYIKRHQIAIEEAHLRAKFGAEFDDYCRQVRRWI
ncbi:methyltransferase family protein [Thaumasiovibrio sp. DFM-14]|uniref:methyltransferase family protein n=1 Tax=Thaumasiovibrio sp. DFM-14 TaxID=3384792 RepID=UPI0039A37553